MLVLGDSSRREFLRAGGLGLGGLSLASLSALGADGPAAAGVATGKSVVFLFLHGGPSQFETFDPKMTAPAEVRSATGEVRTAVPGLTFGASFPKLAARADRLAVVRSFVPGDANHDIKPVVCKDGFGANLGSAYAAGAGGTTPNGVPGNCLLIPRAVDPQAGPEQASFGKFGSSGPFGAAAAPFRPDGDGEFKKDLRLTLPPDRLDDRRELLARFDRLRHGFEAEAGAMDATRQKAFAALLSGAGEAFDLGKEDPRTVARYDTARVCDVAKIDKKWNNHKHYADNARTLGKLLLMARRLVERGAGFVTVTTNFVWDMHADVNNAPVVEGMGYMAQPLDHAVSAFLDDLRDRGLEDQVLLVACGEMGRTPRLNKGGGRDHWGNLGPLLLAGGGLPGGAVIGRSSANGGEAATDPVRIPHLIGTVMRTLFDVGQLRVARGAGRELLQMAAYDPIPGLQG